MIVDSVQTMFSQTVDSTPGSVTQIKEVAAILLRFAKETGIPVILIGHITKEGYIAGSKILSTSWMWPFSSRATTEARIGSCAA